jgi:hypothetical protein
MVDANEQFESSRSLYLQLGQTHLITETLAGLAAIALASQNIDAAFTFFEDILQVINGKPHYGPDRLLWVYLTSYQVLSSVQDPRALEIIKKANTLLHQRLESIPDKNLQKSYLEKIPENKQISEIWEALIKNQ